MEEETEETKNYKISYMNMEPRKIYNTQKDQ